MAVQKGYYLYAIFAEKEPQEFGKIGIGGKGDKVYTLHHKDLAVAVSKTPVQIYDPVRKNVNAHQKVMSAIMQRYDVVPISFGTCVDSYEDLMNIFTRLYDEATATLSRIKNKIEVGLKVYWKKETFAQEVGEANQEVINLKEKIKEQGGGEDTYKQVLELGEKLQIIADAIRQQYVKLVFQPLRAIAEDAVLDEPRHERMIINATFLVNRNKEEEFDLAVNEIYNRYQEKLDFKYTGPWPPYSFVNIKISEED